MRNKLRTSRKPRIVSIGDLVVDVIIEIPKLPIFPDDCQIVLQNRIEPGGAGNFIITGSRLGLDVIPLGVIGNDNSGNAIQEIFSSEGIDINHIVQQTDGTTTTVFVLIDQLNQHVFLGHLGIGPSVPIMDQWKTQLRLADAVISWGYIFREERLLFAFFESLRYARSLGKPIIFDPGPFLSDVPIKQIKDLLGMCSIILLTEEEIQRVSGGYSGDIAINYLLSLGIDLVCVKRGENGCTLHSRHEKIVHPGFSVDVRDTTGAGDAFDAAFTYAYLKGIPLSEVATFANAVGAVKVSKFGSGRQVPTKEEVQTMLRQHNIPDILKA